MEEGTNEDVEIVQEMEVDEIYPNNFPNFGSEFWVRIGFISNFFPRCPYYYLDNTISRA